MKRRLLSLAMVLCLLLSLVPAPAVAAEAAAEHTDHHGVTFDTPWSDAASLPTTAGNYYLTTNVTLTANWDVHGTVNLCLNGHMVNLNGHIIYDNGNSTLNLYDCNSTNTYKFRVENNLWIHDETNGTETITGGVITGGNGDQGAIIIRDHSALNLYGGTLVGNQANDGGAVFINGNCSFTMHGGAIVGNKTKSDSGTGGAVKAFSTFVMNGGTIRDNYAYRGAGVFLAFYASPGEFGDFTMNGGTIANNTSAYQGAGVCVAGNCTFVMHDGTISGNVANGHGGGVHMDSHAAFTMNGGTISDNRTVGGYNNGGGLRVEPNAAFAMHGGTISGNSSSDAGGGVTVAGAFHMTDGTISNNTASAWGGGGVFVTNDGSFAMEGGQITGNTLTGSSGGGGGVSIRDNAVGFTMTGGTISGNTATNTPGDGVHFVSGSAYFKVSGNPVISGNAEDNLYLASGKTLTVTAPLTDGATIGVTTEAAPGDGPVVAAGEGDYTLAAADAAKLSADADGYDVTLAENRLVLGEAIAEYTITFNTNGGNEIAPITGVAGAAVTAPADPTREGYVFIGWDREIPTVMPAESLTITALWDEAHVDHNNVSFRTAWTSDNSLPTGFGNYYLTKDVTLTTDWRFQNTIKICLNGHKIVLGENINIVLVGGNAKLYLYDCGDTVYTFSVNEEGLWVLDPNGDHTVTGGIITGGFANGTKKADKDSGAIDVGTNTLYLYGGTIVGNRAARDGGAMVVDGGVVTMSGGAIIGNVAAETGGAVAIKEGSFTMTGGTIAENRTTSTQYGQGGAIYMSAYGDTGTPTFTMSGGTIRDNQSATDGGAIYMDGNYSTAISVNLTGGTISGNTAVGSGDGVCIHAGNHLNVSNNPQVNDEVYLTSGAAVTVTGALGETAAIKVTAVDMATAEAPVVLAVGNADPAYTVTADDLSRLNVATADNQEVTLDPANNQIVISAKAPAHVDHHDITFLPWTDPTGLPAEGSYYLATDVVLPATETRPALTGTLNLCLNGHLVDVGSGIDVPTGATLNLYDCDTETVHTFTDEEASNAVACFYHYVPDEAGSISITGGVLYGANTVNKVTGTSTSTVVNSGSALIGSGGTIHIYGGTIAGNHIAAVTLANNAGSTLNLHGGTITGSQTGIKALANNTVTISGGAVTGNSYGLDAANTAVTVTGGTITASKGTGVILNANAVFTMSGGDIGGNTKYDLQLSGNQVNFSNGCYAPKVRMIGTTGRMNFAARPEGSITISLKDEVSSSEKSRVVAQGVNGFQFAPEDREKFTVLKEGSADPTVVRENNQIIIYRGAPTRTITFDTDGGSEVAPITKKINLYLLDEIAALPTPTKEGFKFVGWEPEIPEIMPYENLTVKAIWAPAGHEHNGVIFEAWTNATALPDSGNYYLDTDIVLPQTGDYHQVIGNLNLCLCGHVVDLGGGIEVNTGITFNLYDCEPTTEHKFNHVGTTSGSGYRELELDNENGTLTILGGVLYDADRITGPAGSNYQTTKGGNGVRLLGTSVLNMYGGTIAGSSNAAVSLGSSGHAPVFHMYGGALRDSQLGVDTPTSNNSSFYLHGGEICNNHQAVSAYRLNMTGGIIHDNANGISTKSIGTREYTISGGQIYGCNPVRYDLSLYYDVTFSNGAYPAQVYSSNSTSVMEFADGPNGSIKVYIWKGLAEGEERVVARAASGYTFTQEDLAKFSAGSVVEQSGNYVTTDNYYCILRDNEILVTAQAPELREYTITFNTDGGSEVTPITLEAGATITAPPEPTKEGFTFDGWNPALPETMPAEDLTVTAIWNEVIVAHEHESLTFEAWADAAALPGATGIHYLGTDVTLTGDWTVSGTVTLCLNGHRIDLNGCHIIVPAGSTLNIHDCNGSEGSHRFTPTNDLWVYDAANGTETVTGGIIYNGANGETGNGGGAIRVQGILNLHGGSIVGNQTTGWSSGAGVIADGGHITMEGGAIIGNKGAGSAAGGGVYVRGNGTFTMNGGTIASNYSGNYGGGGIYIDNNSTVTMNGGTIRDNYSAGTQSGDSGGGAIAIAKSGSTFIMNGGTISGNESASIGGGLWVNGNFQVSGDAVISGNPGSDVYLPTGKTLTILNALTDGADIRVTAVDTPTEDTPAVIAVAGTGYTIQAADANRLALSVASDDYEIQLDAVNNRVVLAMKEPPHSHESVVFQPWTSTTSLPTSGNWYLTEDIVLPETGNYHTVSGELHLCLNGHVVDLYGGIDVSDGSTLNLYECNTTVVRRFNETNVSAGATNGYYQYELDDESGTIAIAGGCLYDADRISVTNSSGNYSQNSAGSGVTVNGSGTFNFYGGTIAGSSMYGVDMQGAASTLNMYGGCIRHNQTGIYAGVNAETATIQVNGGEICFNKIATSVQILNVSNCSIHDNRSGVSLPNASSVINMSGGELYGCEATRYDLSIRGENANFSNGAYPAQVYLNSVDSKLKFAEAPAEDAHIGLYILSSYVLDEGEQRVVAEATGDFTFTEADLAKFSAGWVGRETPNSDYVLHDDYYVILSEDGRQILVTAELPTATITFDTDGGREIAPVTLEVGAAITAPAAPTKDGYEFGGWSPAIPETMPVGGLTVTAIWYKAHVDHDGITFLPWTNPTKLPTAGNYYLVVDVVMKDRMTTNQNGTLNLCLNGHSVTLEQGEVTRWPVRININRGATMDVYDCNHTELEHKFTVQADGLWVMDDAGEKTVTGGVITGGTDTSIGNDTTGGGAINIYSTGTLNWHGGSIVGNQAAQYGAGVFVNQGATFSMYAGEIAGNVTTAATQNITTAKGADVADGGGAGVAVGGGSFNLYGGSIHDNHAGTDGTGTYVDGIGGGVLVFNSNTNYTTSFHMSGGAIYGNSGAKGAGVYLDNTTHPDNSNQVSFTMTGGTVSGNTATGNGHGVYVNADNHFNVSGTPIISDELYLAEGARIAVTGKLGSGCSLKVNPVVNSGAITSGFEANGNGQTEMSCFQIAKNCVHLESGEVTLGHGYNVTADGAALTIICTSCGDKKQYTVSMQDRFDGKKDNKLTYCGIRHIASISGAGSARVDAYSQKNEDGEWIALADAPTAIGEYRAEIYNNATPDVRAFVEFQIVEPVITQKNNMTYNGSAQGLRVNLPTASTNGPVKYKYSTDGGETYGSLPKFTDAGTYTVYFKAEPWSVNNPNVEDTTPYIGTFIVTVKPKAQDPAAPTINYFDETVTAAESSELAVSNSATEGSAQLDLSHIIAAEETTVYVRSNGNYTSDWIAVTIPARPEAPASTDLVITNETAKCKGDGTIQIPAGMEYQDATGAWQAGPCTVADLGATDVVTVRTAATESSFAGFAADFGVEEGPALTVTFETMGGSTVTAIAGLTYGDKIAAQATTKTGYTLDGWFLNAELTEAWSFESDTVQDNITLYAKWTLNDPAITDQPQGGEITYGESLTLTVQAKEEENLTYTYQWYAKGAEQDTPIDGATASSFTTSADATAGTYTYYCVVTVTDGTGASASIQSADAQIVVEKADPVVTWPTASAPTGSKLSDVETEEGFAWDAPETVVAHGTNRYPMTYTPEDTANYNILHQDVEVTGLDEAAPTGEISIGTNKWSKPLADVTFELFFKEIQTVEITAADGGSGVDKVFYHLANAEVKDFADVAWIVYEGMVEIAANGNYVVYAKVVDKAGNETVINSSGLVIDTTKPVVSGIADGEIYCGPVEVTVVEQNLDRVTVNGEEVTLTDGKFTVEPAKGEIELVFTDKAGNEIRSTITVNDGHTFGDWTEWKDNTSTSTCHCGETMTLTVQEVGIAADKIVEGLREEAIEKLSNLKLVVTEGIADADLAAKKQQDESLKLIDISLYNTATGKKVAETGNVLEIPVDCDLTGKKDVRILRNHNGQISELTGLDAKPAEVKDGTWYFDAEAKVLYIYSNQFSAYGVFYQTPAKPVTPTTGDSVFLWMGLMILSGVSLAAVYLFDKKRAVR